jgi:hypothetical protein
MDIDKTFKLIQKQLKDEGEESFRKYFAHQILVGPFDDTDVAKPGEEHGKGFSIFIGAWRIGWWKTREQACDDAQALIKAIKHISTLEC